MASGWDEADNLNSKQPTATLQATTNADESEERLRLSLSRIGTATARPSRPYQLTQPVRRRFVKDGEVPTEYAGRGHDPQAHAAQSDADEALSALRAELAAEQAAREEAELALAAAKAANRSLQTRVGHMELELEELRARAARAAVEAAAQAARLQEAEARPDAQPQARPGRSPRVAKPVAVPSDDDDDDVADSDGPQPVKWWLKK